MYNAVTSHAVLLGDAAFWNSEIVTSVCDLAAVICVFLAAVLSAAAGIGLLRFPDALSRLHAATKPQIFGLLLVIAAIAFDQRSIATLLGLIPVFVFQSLTAPIAAHMVGRAAYRTGQLDTSMLMVDELGPAIERSDLGLPEPAEASVESSSVDVLSEPDTH